MINLFIDIETIPNTEISKELLDHFDKKKKEDETFEDKAALMGEYGKIVCISVGYFGDDESYKLKSFCGKDEKQILNEFAEMLGVKEYTFIGHNIKSFDMPFLIKRYRINGIPLPKQLNYIGKKPREISIVDTMEIRKGLGRDRVSLELICLALGLPNPKSEVSGKDVLNLYLQDKHDDVSKYCEGDVKATMSVYKKLFSN